MELKGDRIAAYARYSSDRQNDMSVEDQLRRLRSFAAERGREVSPELTFADHAISGASVARPAFDIVMEKVRRREIDVLLVEDTSRLSRDNADALNIFKTFAFYGVQLVAISDGIDSTSKGAKLVYSVKALMSDLYLEDLRDKTLRGMEGRAHTGFSTGGLPIGYRSIAQIGPDGRTPACFKIEVDLEAAAIVRRIFAMYIDGQSQNAIAVRLNAEGLPSPRDRMRHRRKTGWANTTIRAILLNEKYHGVWRFNQRRWAKVPGTNRRIPQNKDSSEVIMYTRPELALVDEETWRRAQERLKTVRAQYTVDSDGKPKGKALWRGGWAHAFSGLLQCQCKSPMTVHGGSRGRRYYACLSARRGRCKYPKGVREDILQRCIVAEIRRLVSLHELITPIRRELAKQLQRDASGSLTMTRLRTRAAELEARIANIVSAIGAGRRIDSVAAVLRQLDEELASTKRTIAERNAEPTLALRSKADLIAEVQFLEDRLAKAPASARETLRQWFGNEPIMMMWNDGHFVAHADVSLETILIRAAGTSKDGVAALRLTDSHVLATLRTRVALRCPLRDEQTPA